MAKQTKHTPPPIDSGFDMEQEIRRQAERVRQAKLEKDCSYYDHCKSLMARIHRDYQLAFFCSCAICLIVAAGAVFKKHFQIFSLVAKNMGEPDNFVAIFCGGFAQVFLAAAVVIIALLGWAYLHRCNLLLTVFYGAMTILGIVHGDWISAFLGAAGTVFSLRAVLAMFEEERLRELDGYPNFNRPLTLSKDDFDHAPQHPDAPDRDKAYTEMLAKKAESAAEKKQPQPVSPVKPEAQTPADRTDSIIEEIFGDAPKPESAAPKRGKKGKKHDKRN